MNPSFGSGSSLLGAPASAVLGMPPGAMQQSPSSASFTPGMMPPPPSPMGTPPPMLGAQPPTPQQSTPMGQQPAPALPPQGGVVGMPPENQESMLILQALSNRLKSLSKVSESQKIPPTM